MASAGPPPAPGPARREVVDVHSHILLEGVMGLCGEAGPEMGVRPGGTHYFRAGQYVLEGVRFVGSPFADVEVRLEHMARLGIDHQVVSPNPITYFYRQPARLAVDFNRRHNDLVAEVAAANDRLSGFACLPLQDPAAAAAELERAVTELGLVGSYIGSDVGGVPLSDPRFEEVWAEHERLGVPVVVHPAPRNVERPGDADYARWELDVVYGFLVDEGLAVAHLVLGGVLDRHPRLAVHVPHGGGFAPYQVGRLETALEKRPWGRGLLRRSFEEQWSQLSFDTAVHRADALAFLVATQGAGRVLHGCNFAGWDQEERSVAMVEALAIGEEEKAAILAGNARRLFRLREPGARS
ncbi:MAG TPA: amidohydrolase family protein [Acidimicrobiales bacterium]|nr:amidohydrolase family protein [Acidimicrobiales bacterium]